MSSETIISLERISKCYRIYDRPEDRLKQFFMGRWRKFFTEFWAIHEVSFSIPKGACYGIIGRNGAGKSTLLQIIAGILEPTSGVASVRGRVAALLELGTGFNPEFSGRENIYINGAILGLSRAELEAKMEQIVAFADIGPFLEQPVKTYSSGMMVRLAFAVAVHVDPEVLIVDEALAVGDAKFQAKCFRKFQEFREAGKTILFVTHSIDLIVRHCDYAILLEKGSIVKHGEPKDVANFYLDMLFGGDEREKGQNPSTPSPVDKSPERYDEQGGAANHSDTLRSFLSDRNGSDQFAARPGYNHGEFRWGNRDAEIVDCLITNHKGEVVNHFTSTDTLLAAIKVRFNRDISQPVYGLTLKTPDGLILSGNNSRDIPEKPVYKMQRAGDVEVVQFSFVPLLYTGHYFLSFGVVYQPEDGSEVIALDRRYDAIEIFITNYGRGHGLIDLSMTIVTEFE